MQALLDNDLLGVALLRAPDWVPVITNAAYDAILPGGPARGRPLADVILDSMLEGVMSTGRGARVSREPIRAGAADELATRFVTFMLLPARAITPDGGDGILILARDVSNEVHDERMAELFLLLARDMSAERDEVANIRSAVAHAKDALGASAASIFLLAPGGKSLHGAIVGWDWTRSSFVADLEEWPNVARAIARNEACHFTAAHAERAEEGWFERRGISAAIGAPMAADGRVVGVLFFDYSSTSQAQVDLTLAKTVADQCALLVESERARVTGI